MPFICLSCRHTLTRWQGQCPRCKGWRIVAARVSDPDDAAPAPDTVTLHQISKMQVRAVPIYRTGIPALDNALGGGLPRGTTTLFTGDPGIGKSTLLLQALSNMSVTQKSVYISAEETGQQIVRRARRIGLGKSRASVFQCNDVDTIIEMLESESVSICVVDSVQAIESSQIDYPKGSIPQIRECAMELVNASQRLGVTTILVCHVAKDGTLAGPRTIEHLADAVLYLQAADAGDVQIVAEKNRNGPIMQPYLMRMTEKGLISL